ncbi:MAG TPA: hypothetical protein VGF13_16230 [Verrucomicrobiae bacterium]|jgi:hypothetical protein
MKSRPKNKKSIPQTHEERAAYWTAIGPGFKLDIDVCQNIKGRSIEEMLACAAVFDRYADQCRRAADYANNTVAVEARN